MGLLKLLKVNDYITSLARSCCGFFFLSWMQSGSMNEAVIVQRCAAVFYVQHVTAFNVAVVRSEDGRSLIGTLSQCNSGAV